LTSKIARSIRFLGTTFLPSCTVFVRVKTISGRRYAYLVEGVREGRRVRQKTLCYLGPLPRLFAGVPDDVAKKAAPLPVDWKKVNDKVRQIPLTPDELSEVRRARYSGQSGRFLEGRWGAAFSGVQQENHN
jgi:hypothetical protein